ncbi:MAG: MFS transporter [Dermatophilaceae bacterium]
MVTTQLPGSVRRGYALGGVATGSFGTVPGLLLLPYLTDRLGVAAGLAGLVVFLPKAWDVILNPIAGRISDRSTNPAGRRRPFLLRAGLALAICFALLFAGPTSPTEPGRRVGRRALPRLRHGIRVLPSALCLDAGRTHRRL